MHELSLGQAIIDTIDRHREGRRVERVTVRIGHLRQVVPDSLRFSFEVLVADTDLAECELVIDHIPAVVVCNACGVRTTLDMPLPMCGSCHSGDVELVSGKEFQVASIDVAEEVH